MEGKAYLADQGGQFASDTHRRVLGHLSPPGDSIGWRVEALFNRMLTDQSTNIQSVDETQGILNELEGDGYARKVTVGDHDVWTMTQEGFDLLTGGIANEPPPGAAVTGPAMVGLHGAGAATLLDGSTGAPLSAGEQDQTSQATEGGQQ